MEKPLVLIPAPAMAGEALILRLSCHLPRCWCLVDFLCSIRLRSQMGPQGWHVTSSLGLSSFLRGRECQLRCCENLGQLPPFVHFAASFILRDCQAVRHPTPVLVPRRGRGSFYFDQWKQDVGEHRCGDGGHTWLLRIGSAQYRWPAFGPRRLHGVCDGTGRTT